MILKKTLRLVFVLCCLIGSTSTLSGQVFLDYTDFQARLDELTTSAGVTAFDAGEVATIQAGIKSDLEAAYAGFDGLSFTEVDPGGARPDLVFGLTGSGLGVADHIDFLNQVVNDRARIFTAEFTFVLDEFSGSTNRSTQIEQITAALAGTAAHEFGHNLGLRHHDAYGSLTYEGTAVNTGNEEDTHVMATGSTGLGEVGRETLRTFSTNSLVKIAYADTTLAGGNPTAVVEGADIGGTTGTAMSVDLEAIPVANRFGEVIVGTLATDDDEDMFSVELAAGSLFTVDVNNDFGSGVGFDSLDTVIDFLDTSGSVLFTNDDTLYSTTEFGAGTTRSTDSAFYNINIATAGTYFVRLRSFSASDSGDYQLLLHTDMFTAVPEPTSAGLLLLGGVFCLIKRRRTTC